MVEAEFIYNPKTIILMLKANYDGFFNVLNQFGVNSWLLQVLEKTWVTKVLRPKIKKSAARITPGRQVRKVCLVRMVVSILYQQERIEDQTHCVKKKPNRLYQQYWSEVRCALVTGITSI